VPERIESSSVVVGLNAHLSRPAGGSGAGMLLLPMISGISARVREFADGFALAALDDQTCLAEQRRPPTTPWTRPRCPPRSARR
jgi:hypothetical protein